MMKNIREYIAETVSKTISAFDNQVDYLRYDTDTERNKYGESKRKSYHEPITFNAIIRFSPSRENLEEFGMDKDNTDVLVKIPRLDLEREGVEPHSDDKILINGTHYFITSLNFKGWAENNQALIIIGCSRRSDNRAKK